MPGFKRLPGRRDGLPDVFDAGVGTVGNDLAGGRVPGFKGPSGLGGNPLSSNKITGLVLHGSPSQAVESRSY